MDFSGQATTGTIAGHEYVDLGLSVMWATCNVGAISSEEYGDYYAWGEMETKSSYNIDNCETLEKRISYIKGTSRDVAHVKWGGSWRMPTEAEFDELRSSDNCTWTWTTQGGHEGYKVTSRKNGNSIFFPAAGWRYGTSLGVVGLNANYWSSSPHKWSSQNACYLYFDYFDDRNPDTGWTDRYHGHTVRPVAELSLDDDVETHRRLLACNDESVSQPANPPTSSRQVAKDKEAIASHDYVDMGLSVKWATCNIGASSPEDYGDYYAWGETETKSSFREGNCETYEESIGDIKGTSRDVARVKWGGSWRMPTWAEFEELLDSDNCTWTWTTQGVNEGYKVTSRKNGNSIFLPAAGWRGGTSLYDADQEGNYWSSSPRGSDFWYAYGLYFDSRDHGTGSNDRYDGHTVRPVMSLDDDVETHRRLLAGNDDNVSQPLGAPAASPQSAKVKGTIAGHDYVDMGLSVKWATCNVGASSPEEYGNYYAWGETETSYDEDSCETYGKDIGDIGGTSRDVAHVKWGGSWRMPTKAEFDELLDSDNCTWTWTTQGGHEGYKVTSRKNGNSIFLPAAGVRNETSLGDAGKYGHYWSSTPYWGGAQIAYSLYFGWSDHGTCPNYRDYWRTIRPVAESVRAAKGTINGHAYVDLGLSVKWATCNVGADSPGAYGNYYAWGETKTKSSYGEDNCETYGKDIGDIKGTSRDVARVKWGGSWRMPTKAEFEELLNTANCTWTWITEGGHRGYKVTSKKNGNSIFLPAAGYRYGTPASIGSYYYGMSLHDAGQHGDYWSSTPHGSDPQGAYKLSFGSSNRYTFWECRNGGLTIRPVTE